MILLLQVRIERCLNRGALALLHTVDVLRDPQLLECFILLDKLWHQVQIILESARSVEENAASAGTGRGAVVALGGLDKKLSQRLWFHGYQKGGATYSSKRKANVI